MSKATETNISAIEKHLPRSIVRGPFRWDLVRDDGLSVFRDSGMDAVRAYYRGTLGTVLQPLAMLTDPETDEPMPDDSLAVAAKNEADRAWEFYQAVHSIIEDWCDE
jgi:hypothetical protein